MANPAGMDAITTTGARVWPLRTARKRATASSNGYSAQAACSAAARLWFMTALAAIWSRNSIEPVRRVSPAGGTRGYVWSHRKHTRDAPGRDAGGRGVRVALPYRPVLLDTRNCLPIMGLRSLTRGPQLARSRGRPGGRDRARRPWAARALRSGRRLRRRGSWSATGSPHGARRCRYGGCALGPPGLTGRGLQRWQTPWVRPCPTVHRDDLDRQGGWPRPTGVGDLRADRRSPTPSPGVPAVHLSAALNGRLRYLRDAITGATISFGAHLGVSPFGVVHLPFWRTAVM